MVKMLAIAGVLGSLAGGCKELECGVGTIDKNGTCVPADETVSDAKCGPFTELRGDVCVPIFPPTQCDDGTTAPDVDPATGVVTCIGTGGGGCNAPLACPQPADGKQTICGQIYDLKDDSKFAAPDATGAQCTEATATGPCSVDIHAYDAIVFGTNPQTAPKLPPTDQPGGVYVDDCGRFRIENISVPSGPLIAIGVDDATVGPMGSIGASGFATLKVPGTATRDTELFVANIATVGAWQASGGPPVTGGMAISIFRSSKTGRTPQAGVTVTKSGNTIPNNDFYFTANETNRGTIDPNATATGANGTALITGAAIGDGLVFSAQQGPLPPECKWETHGAVSLPFILFVQIYRPTNNGAMTCNL
ncbi:MAG: hypothetical protein KIT31_30760 [Deltaproteobacteria bacterium]|nr:hypothetical protein [Deltaproteobacteria bacterium]